MTIETASGHNLQNVTEEQLKDSLSGLNSDNDFLILSGEEDYIQCAYSETGFIAEYQDASGHYGSGPGLSIGIIEKIFVSYLTGSEEWKTLTAWTVDEIPETGSASDQNGQKPFNLKGAIKGDLSPDKLFGAVKNQIAREAGREVTRKTSKLVGKMIRKITK